MSKTRTDAQTNGLLVRGEQWLTSVAPGAGRDGRPERVRSILSKEHADLIHA